MGSDRQHGRDYIVCHPGAAVSQEVSAAAAEPGSWSGVSEQSDLKTRVSFGTLISVCLQENAKNMIRTEVITTRVSAEPFYPPQRHFN